MASRENTLEFAERLIAEQRVRIIEQHTKIGELRDAGISAAASIIILDRMYELLDTMIADLTRLKR